MYNFNDLLHYKVAIKFNKKEQLQTFFDKCIKYGVCYETWIELKNEDVNKLWDTYGKDLRVALYTPCMAWLEFEYERTAHVGFNYFDFGSSVCFKEEKYKTIRFEDVDIDYTIKKSNGYAELFPILG